MFVMFPSPLLFVQAYLLPSFKALQKKYVYKEDDLRNLDHDDVDFSEDRLEPIKQKLIGNIKVKE